MAPKRRYGTNTSRHSLPASQHAATFDSDRTAVDSDNAPEPAASRTLAMDFNKAGNPMLPIPLPMSSSAEERGDWGVMQEKIRTDLKRFLSKQTQRRPLIMPVILEI